MDGVNIRTLTVARVIDVPSTNSAMPGRGEIGALSIDQYGSQWVRASIGNGLAMRPVQAGNQDTNESLQPGLLMAAPPPAWRVWTQDIAGGPVSVIKPGIANRQHVLTGMYVNCGSLSGVQGIAQVVVESPTGNVILLMNLTWTGLTTYQSDKIIAPGVNAGGNIGADMVIRTTFSSGVGTYHQINMHGYTVPAP